MGVVHETLPVAAFYTEPTKIVPAALALTALLANASKTFEVVHGGEMGIKIQNGKPKRRKGERSLLVGRRKDLTDEELAEFGQYVTLTPRLYPLVPLWQKVAKVNVQDRADEVRGFDIETNDGQQYTADPRFIWFIRSDGDYPYRALYNVKNNKDNKDVANDTELREAVLTICLEGLSEALSNKSSRELIRINRKALSRHTEELCREDLLQYGAALRKVVVPSIRRGREEVLKQGLERSGSSSLGAIAMGAIEADENGMGQVIPFRSGDAA